MLAQEGALGLLYGSVAWPGKRLSFYNLTAIENSATMCTEWLGKYKLK